MVVFPEMAVTGYFPDLINCTDCATRLPAAEQLLAEACRQHGMYAIVGIPKFVNATHYFNTALVIDPTGAKIYRQAKLYLAWKFDGMVGTWLDTFQIMGVNVSLMICADEFFPEAARLTAMKGSQVLFYLSWEGDESIYETVFMDAYQALPMARGVENNQYVVQANAAELNENTGTLGGSHGESKIVDPKGHVLQKAGIFVETLLVQDLDLTQAPGCTFCTHHPLFKPMW